MTSDRPPGTGPMAMSWERQVDPERPKEYRMQGAEAAYRRHVVRANITLAIVALLIAPPIIGFLLIAAIVMRFPLIEASAVTYVLGMGITGVIVASMARRVAKRSDTRLTGFLHEAFQEQHGLPGGEHVGFRHRVGDGVLAQLFEGDHDTGLLFIYDSELVLEGLHERLRLGRKHIRGAGVRTIGSPALLGGHWCEIQVQTGDDAPSETYFFQPRPGGRNRTPEEVAELASRINQWVGVPPPAQ